MQKSNRFIKYSLSALVLCCFSPVPLTFAQEQQEAKALDRCIKSALQDFPGRVVAVRHEIDQGRLQYEVDIRGTDGQSREVECDIVKGNILKRESDVVAEDPAFTSRAKLRLDAALKIALDKYPGAVKGIEYEIEDDGVAYEFDILLSDGRLLEVEVSAMTGELSAPEEVVYEIGSES
jgi:Predicted membrane protein